MSIRSQVVVAMQTFPRNKPYTVAELATVGKVTPTQAQSVLTYAKGAGLVEHHVRNGGPASYHNRPEFLAGSVEGAMRRLNTYKGTAQDSLLRERIKANRKAVVEIVHKAVGTFTPLALGLSLTWSVSSIRTYLNPLIQCGLVVKVPGSPGVYRRGPSWGVERALGCYKSVKHLRARKTPTRPRPVTNTADYATGAPVLEPTPAPVAPKLSLTQMAEWKAKAEKYDRLLAQLKALGIEPEE